MGNLLEIILLNHNHSIIAHYRGGIIPAQGGINLDRVKLNLNHVNIIPDQGEMKLNRVKLNLDHVKVKVNRIKVNLNRVKMKIDGFQPSTVNHPPPNPTTQEVNHAVCQTIH